MTGLRAWLWACAALCAAGLRADGDSGTALRTPFKLDDGGNLVENDANATFTLGSAKRDPVPASQRDGWKSAGGAGCYARRDGVGLRTAASGHLVKPFEAEEPVRLVVVTCSAATASSAKAESLRLCLRLSDADEEVERELAFGGEQGVEQTVRYLFDAPRMADRIDLSTPGNNVFEVARVRWFAELPPVTTELLAPSSALVCTPFHCSLGELFGGSGDYVSAVFVFNGEAQVVERPEGGEAVAFTAPEVDGDYTLSLTLTDSMGNTAVFEKDIRVTLFMAPYGLAASGVTRKGFGLSWQTGPISPSKVSVAVAGSPASETVVESFAPKWTPVEADVWEAEALDLAALSGGEPFKSGLVLLPEAYWTGSLAYSQDGGATWKALTGVAGHYMTFSAKAAVRQPFLLRATAVTPPRAFRISLLINRSYASKTLSDPSQHSVSLSGLPAGRPLSVTVSATYARDSGGKVVVKSDPLVVALPPVPPFAGGDYDGGLLWLAWPSDAEGLSAEAKVFEERAPASALPPGLYLTRTWFTTASGNSGFETGKAIALSNTTDAPIALDGTRYALAYGKAGATPSVWDFKNAKTPEKPYPYVVPAHGDLLIAHATYPLSPLRSGVETNNTAALNFTPAHTLTLLRDGEPVNALGAATNAILRLEDNRPDAVAKHPLYPEAPVVSPFYDAWSPPAVTNLLATLSLAELDGQSLLSNAYSPANTDGLRRIWAECTLSDGISVSQPCCYTFWERLQRAGYRLRLR